MKIWNCASMATIPLGLVWMGGFAPAIATAADGIRAAYVETVIPSRSFFGVIDVSNASAATGPGTGVLGVSTIVLTSNYGAPVQVAIFSPIMSGDDCTGAVIGGASTFMYVYVQPTSSLVLTYPSPWVFNPVTGSSSATTCVAAEAFTTLTGAIKMSVTGLVN